jgi:TolB-like protein
MPGGTDIARGLRDQLIAQLTKLDGVVVLAPVVSEARLPAASVFSLQGNIASEKSSLHVQVRLIRSGDGSVVWAKRFDQQTQGRTVLDLQDEIGLQIVKDISTIGEINDKSVTK